jgi:hypothetical protein
MLSLTSQSRAIVKSTPLNRPQRICRCCRWKYRASRLRTVFCTAITPVLRFEMTGLLQGSSVVSFNTYVFTAKARIASISLSLRRISRLSSYLAIAFLDQILLLGHSGCQSTMLSYICLSTAKLSVDNILLHGDNMFTCRQHVSSIQNVSTSMCYSFTTSPPHLYACSG